ncbi:MAG: GNVR domain-containing protein [Actinomycetota bacterium]
METQETASHQNPMAYLKIFFRRKWFIITPAFIGVVLGIVACFVIPPTYESNTLIIVEEEKIINPLIQGLAVSTSASQRMNAIKERILGWNSLLELSKELNLVKNAQTPAQLEDLISDLRKNISVTMREPNLVRISYLNSNPKQTLQVTQALTDILVEENVRSQTRETDVAINFIKEQLEVYKRKIKESEVSQLEEELRNLLVDSTEEHPLVKELRSKITAAKKELESGNFKVATVDHPVTGPAYEGLKQELDKIISKEAASATNISSQGNANASVYKLLLTDKLGSSMGRDLSVNESIYNILLQKLETAKITQRLEASKEGTRYNIVEPPHLPLRPIKPNKIKLILFGLFIGGASGIGIVLGRDFMDHSFLDIEDAKNSLELPILGAISRLTTVEEIDLEKTKREKFIKLVLKSSLALIIAAILFSLIKR